MKKLLNSLACLFIFSASCAATMPAAPQSAQSVTLVPPYISLQSDELTDQISVHAAIAAIAEQAGLRCEWKTSFANSIPIMMWPIQPEIRNKSWQEALEIILKPLNLTYTTASGKLVIDKAPALQAMAIQLTKSVTFMPPYAVQPGEDAGRISVQFAVIAIAKQVGLGYNWDKSAKNIDAVARRWITIDVRHKSAKEALDMICRPLNLIYWIESNQIVLDFFPAPPKSTMAAWIRAANRGNVRVQGILGQRYLSGDEGLPQDRSKAVKWLAKAAANGDCPSQYTLGDMYAAGNGIAKDPVKAYFYLHLAAIGAKGSPSEMTAGKKRDALAEQMTPPQIEKAQAQAKQWIAGYLQKAGNGPYVVGWGVTKPEPQVQTSPMYTPAARQANIHGAVVLQCVINKNGMAQNCKLLKGLGYGLDESAANAIATTWRFKPGAREGVPVDVLTNIEIPFK